MLLPPRRWSVLVLALSLLGASCAGGETQEAAGRDGAAAPPTSTSTTPEASTSSTDGGGGSSTSMTAGVPSTTATTRQQGTAPAPATSAPTAPSTTVTSARPVALADARVRLVRVASLDQPLALALRAGDDAFYIAEKRGRVRAVRGGHVAADTVLDLSSEVSVGGEQGLLGIAFSPDGSRFYASFTDRSGDSRLWEYAFRDGKADPATRREVMAQDQPFANHNGGQITFGPDGMLYYFLGDGGSGGDPAGNAQNLGTLLGKVLRIDPAPSGDRPYTIPADNPFVGRPGARGEIFSYGLRNPWRASFDRLTGDVWIGDVGQNAIEEIDFSPRDRAAGANYGWSAYEGSKRFKPAIPAEGHVPPVWEYPTSDGCAVTAGYVYRGSAIPALAGAFLFSDFCHGDIQALRLVDGRVAEHRSLGIRAESLASFGEGPDGELYVLSLEGGFFRIDPA